MTQQEIKGLQEAIKREIDRCKNFDYEGEVTWQCQLASLERLEKLEAAVAFRSFDELPEAEYPHNRFTGPKVDLKDTKGNVYRFNHTGDAESYIRKGYVGWRYPVEDLSE